MSYTVRWRTAIALSVFFHIFFGMAVGYMTFQLTVSPPADEQVIELDVSTLSDREELEEPELEIPSPNLPVQETAPLAEETIPTETPPIASDDIVEPKPIPIQVVTATPDTTTVINNNKHSVMGTPPVVLTRVDPTYPSEVDQIGRKIIVVLRMKIMENGLPGKVEVAVSSGQKSINDAAIAAAKKWRFEPAKDREGRPIVCSTILSIPFTPE
ncbi:energy transducer TonB [Pelosinus sp. sgz500959]|uniref:energy transducer TonB n=1 Tax=Pelosinus sp. sgz500959 TaxID=3242472 RepID=UPI0036721D22